jgi:hypothetical protein
MHAHTHTEREPFGINVGILQKIYVIQTKLIISFHSHGSVFTH